MSILKLISNNNFIVVNKFVIKQLGLHEAVILGDFATASTFNNNDGWFFRTYEKIKEETGISKHPASKAITNLVKNGILQEIKRGVPCKKYFKIQEVELLNVLQFKNSTPSSSKIERLEVEKLNGINNTSINNTSINKKSEKKETPTGGEKLKKLKEEIEDKSLVANFWIEFVKEEFSKTKDTIDGDKSRRIFENFYEHYLPKWRLAKKTFDYKACVRRWVRQDFNKLKAYGNNNNQAINQTDLNFM